jgi:nitrite reductase/ring-hydroxylating ferredoxin subunit
VTTESQQDTPDVPARPTRPGRRGVLAGAGLAGVAGVISACGFGGSSSSAASGSGGQAGSGSGGSGGGGSANGALASTSEIPVGGGKVFSSQQIVITQPEAGTFKGFSAICTHMQCTVDQVANGTIDCPCHGSQFSVKDGAVVAGPAPKPLPAANITVTGSKITLG